MNDEVIGGTILECPVWGNIIVRGADGIIYEIRIVNGHSGPENEVVKS